MSDRIHVATRKGLFSLARHSAGWAVDGADFLGIPVTAVLQDSRDGWRYAALAHGHFGPKLHRAAPGAAFEECATPAFAEGAGTDAPSVAQIWCLEEGSEPGGLLAGVMPAALFHSPDRGQRWQLNEGLWARPERSRWFGGGTGEPALHSVLIDRGDPQRILIAVSCGGVWVSADGGQSWDASARGLTADYVPPEQREDPNVQDPHRLAQCRAEPRRLWIQHHNGIFRSDDGGRSWQRIPRCQPSDFGFAVAAHPQDADTAWFVPARSDGERIPVDGRVVVLRTTDGGLSFTICSEGLPRHHAYDLVHRHGLDVDAAGRRLAFGSTSGGVWISEDGGDRWSELPARLPPVHAVRFAP